jgi:hypothetical protein
MMFQGYLERGFVAKDGHIEILTKLLGHAPRRYKDFAEETVEAWQQVAERRLHQPESAMSCSRGMHCESHYLASLRCRLSRGAWLFPSCCGSFSRFGCGFNRRWQFQLGVSQYDGGLGAAAGCAQLLRPSAAERLYVLGSRPQGMESF